MNAFRNVIRCGVVIAGLVMAAAAARADDVQTNQALALQLAAWHVRLDRGDATSTLKEVEKALQTTQWRTPVFTGTNSGATAPG